MAKKGNETTTKFKVDISQLKSAMTEAKRQIAVTNSEFKAIASTMDDWSKSTDGLKAKLTQLDSNLNSQKTILSSLERQYELTVEQMGEGSAQADRLKIAINNQKAVINATEREIDKYNTTLTEVEAEEKKTGKNADYLGEDLDELTDKARESSEGFTVFKGVLANLATQGINLLIDGVKSATGAMVGLVKESVMSYAEAEQLIGGVETLFKESAGTVLSYANVAYKTAGLSANDYMSTVTSFSASLLQSLGGDTELASEVANRAIIDMSDNANKMGTSMESIQNAYNGFAKGTYTMLDNLKLGYGGTQEEMKRLIKDASALNDIQEELGITVDANSMSFANIVNAISVVQANLDIMGTTAKEASTTIEGSLSSMGSAWANLLTGMASDQADFGELVDNLVESVGTVLDNITPRVIKALGGISELFSKIAPIIADQLPALIDEILPPLLDSLGTLLEAVLEALVDSLPTIINALATIASDLLDKLPSIMDSLIDAVYYLVDELILLAPDFLEAGIKLFTALVEALPDITDKLLDNLDALMGDLIYGLLEALPQIIEAGIKLFSGLIEALPQVITELLKYLPILIEDISRFLVESTPQLLEAGISLFTSLIEAIPVIVEALVEALPDLITAIIQGLLGAMPQLLEANITLLMTLIEAIPVIVEELAEALPEIIDTITNTLLDNMPLILETWLKVFNALIKAIPQIALALAKALPQIIGTIMGAMTVLKEKLTEFTLNLIAKVVEWAIQARDKAGEGAKELVNNVISFIKELPSKVAGQLALVIAKVATFVINLREKAKEAGKTFFDTLVNKIKELPDKLKELGSDIVKGLWNGINDMTGWIADKIKGFGDAVVGGLKDFFGIHSPSKLMAEEVGKYLPEGIAVGITDNAKSVMSAMKNLAIDAVGATRQGLSTVSTGSAITGGVVNNFYQTNNSPKSLSRLEIYRQSKNLLGYAGGGF